MIATTESIIKGFIPSGERLFLVTTKNIFSATQYKRYNTVTTKALALAFPTIVALLSSPCFPNEINMAIFKAISTNRNMKKKVTTT